VVRRHEALELELSLLSRHLLPIRRLSRGRRLERSAYTLLTRMAAEGPMSIAELSEVFGLDASTLSRQTAAMTRAGDLERLADPQGGKARKFRATAAGMQHLEADRRANAEWLRTVIAGWPKEDVDTFICLIRRFNADLENLDSRRWSRG